MNLLKKKHKKKLLKTLHHSQIGNTVFIGPSLPRTSLTVGKKKVILLTKGHSKKNVVRHISLFPEQKPQNYIGSSLNVEVKKTPFFSQWMKQTHWINLCLGMFGLLVFITHPSLIHDNIGTLTKIFPFLEPYNWRIYYCGFIFVKFLLDVGMKRAYKYIENASRFSEVQKKYLRFLMILLNIGTYYVYLPVVTILWRLCRNDEILFQHPVFGTLRRKLSFEEQKEIINEVRQKFLQENKDCPDIIKTQLNEFVSQIQEQCHQFFEKGDSLYASEKIREILEMQKNVFDASLKANLSKGGTSGTMWDSLYQMANSLAVLLNPVNNANPRDCLIAWTVIIGGLIGGGSLAWTIYNVTGLNTQMAQVLALMATLNANQQNQQRLAERVVRLPEGVVQNIEQIHRGVTDIQNILQQVRVVWQQALNIMSNTHELIIDIARRLFGG